MGGGDDGGEGGDGGGGARRAVGAAAPAPAAVIVSAPHFETVVRCGAARMPAAAFCLQNFEFLIMCMGMWPCGVGVLTCSPCQDLSILLADDLSDKLKLLDYEDTFCNPKDIMPFSRTYFAIAAQNTGYARAGLGDLKRCWARICAVCPSQRPVPALPGPGEVSDEELPSRLHYGQVR